MRAAASHMKDPVMEVLLFRVGGVRYGVPLGQVVGLIHDVPEDAFAPYQLEAQVLHFEGRKVPVLPADDYFHAMGPQAAHPRDAIILDDGAGLFGVCVDAAETVVEVVPGDDLYMLPPRAPDHASSRPWGVLTVSERPILLLDLARVPLH